MPDLLEEAKRLSASRSYGGEQLYRDLRRAQELLAELVERVERAEVVIRADHRWHAEQAGGLPCSCEFCLAAHHREDER